jgi:hypothetical protein
MALQEDSDVEFSAGSAAPTGKADFSTCSTSGVHSFRGMMLNPRGKPGCLLRRMNSPITAEREATILDRAVAPFPMCRCIACQQEVDQSRGQTAGNKPPSSA